MRAEESQNSREESKGDYDDDEDEHTNDKVKFVVEGPREEVR